MKLLISLSIFYFGLLNIAQAELPRLYTIEGKIKGFDNKYATLEYDKNKYIVIEKAWILKRHLRINETVKAKMTYDEIDYARKFTKKNKKRQPSSLKKRRKKSRN